MTTHPNRPVGEIQSVELGDGRSALNEPSECSGGKVWIGGEIGAVVLCADDRCVAELESGRVAVIKFAEVADDPHPWITLERAGRTDEALTTYATALEVYPEHIATMQALARLQLRTGRADDRTPKFLEEIALRGETEAWRAWARIELTQTQASGDPR